MIFTASEWHTRDRKGMKRSRLTGTRLQPYKNAGLANTQAASLWFDKDPTQHFHFEQWKHLQK